jgi:hypothetical protein
VVVVVDVVLEVEVLDGVVLVVDVDVVDGVVLVEVLVVLVEVLVVLVEVLVVLVEVLVVLVEVLVVNVDVVDGVVLVVLVKVLGALVELLVFLVEVLVVDVDGVVLVEVLGVLVKVLVVLVEVLGYFSPSVSSSSSPIVASVMLTAARVVSVSSCTGTGSGMYNILLIQKCAEAYAPGTPRYLFRYKENNSQTFVTASEYLNICFCRFAVK